MSPANEKEKKGARRATEGFLFYSRLMMNDDDDDDDYSDDTRKQNLELGSPHRGDAHAYYLK
jgi:hypothetical protein